MQAAASPLWGHNAPGPLILRLLFGIFDSPLKPSHQPTPLLLEELLVEEEDEQVHVDLGLIKHLHDCYTLVLQLQQVLGERGLSPPPALHVPPASPRSSIPQGQGDQHGAGFAPWRCLVMLSSWAPIPPPDPGGCGDTIKPLPWGTVMCSLPGSTIGTSPCRSP